MGQIDWSAIEGYREEMTAEEKLALLERREEAAPPPAQETPAPPVQREQKGTVSKVQFDKLASELAAAKKALRSRLTEDEQREAARQEEQEAMRLELETLRRERTVSGYRASYLGLGFEEELAAQTAEAMADGDMDRVFANLKTQMEGLRKKLTAEIMKNTPLPPAGEEQNANRRKREEENMLRRSMGLPEIKLN